MSGGHPAPATGGASRHDELTATPSLTITALLTALRREPDARARR